MARLHKLPLETQIGRLRVTIVASLLIGISIAQELQTHHHVWWAVLVGIVTLEAAAGSAIIMGDLKRDLRERRDAAAKAEKIPG